MKTIFLHSLKTILRNWLKRTSGDGSFLMLLAALMANIYASDNHQDQVHFILIISFIIQLYCKGLLMPIADLFIYRLVHWVAKVMAVYFAVLQSEKHYFLIKCSFPKLNFLLETFLRPSFWLVMALMPLINL